MKTKFCKSCNSVKGVKDFYKHKGTSDGLWTECKKCNINRTLRWQKNNHEKKLINGRIDWVRNRKKRLEGLRKQWLKRDFAGMRDKALIRDKCSCVQCAMTQEAHLLKFGKDITVDHIDRNRNNNSMDNLQVLCLHCHGKKDNLGTVKSETRF